MITLHELESACVRATREVRINGRAFTVRTLTMAEYEEIDALCESNPARNALHAALALGLEPDRWDAGGLGAKPRPAEARMKGTPERTRMDYAREIVPEIKRLLTAEEIVAVIRASQEGGAGAGGDDAGKASSAGGSAP